MAFLIALLLPILALAQVTASDLTWVFESGSLQSAATVQPNELNLTLRLDDNFGDLYGWYDFKILQNAAGQTVTFHILNPDGWMTALHKPVYSQDGGANWLRVNETWTAGGDFHFRQTFSADSAEIALAFPYSYSRLMSDLDQLTGSLYCHYESVGQSVHGRAIPLVTITDPFTPEVEKRTAWLMCRQHPMEAPTSLLLNAYMQFLIDPENLNADRIRRTTIFKITPMVNVDGVAEGYSRHNVNGINLNRCWAYDSLYAGEQPEVNAIHRTIDDWIYSGHSLDFFNDFHCAPDLYDFGYKLSAIYSFPAHYQDETSFTKHLDEWDIYQDWAQWRDLDSAYGSGLVTMALYQQHGTMGLSSENSWSRRGNGQYITVLSLEQEGLMYVTAIDEYLHQMRIINASGDIVEELHTGDQLLLRVDDPDENINPSWMDTVQATVWTESSGDTEEFVLPETWIATGQFANAVGYPIISAAGYPHNGSIEVSASDRIFAAYVDDEFPRDSSWAIAAFETTPVSRQKINPPPQPQSLAVEPNPFNGATVLSFELRVASHVNLRIYDTAGRLVQILANGWQEAGYHEVTFDGSDLPSGLYIHRLEAGEFHASQKLVLLK